MLLQPGSDDHNLWYSDNPVAIVIKKLYYYVMKTSNHSRNYITSIIVRKELFSIMEYR